MKISIRILKGFTKYQLNVNDSFKNYEETWGPTETNNVYIVCKYGMNEKRIKKIFQSKI